MELTAYTPALLPGSRGGTTPVPEGDLPEGFTATLFHHTFAEGRTRRESTIVLASVPESIAFAPALVCRDRGAMGAADLAQLPAETWEETAFESAAFNDRYRLFTLVGQDAGWVRELFSPQLIAWLDSRAPDGMSFELNEGHLTVALPGHLTSADEIAELGDAATELEDRIRKEAGEEGADPDLFREIHELRDLDEAIPSVNWKGPPASVSQAIGAYRRVAWRRPRVLLGALLWAAAIAAVMGGIAFAVGGPLAGVPAAFVTFFVVLPVAIFLRGLNYRFGSVGASRVGLEAFVREYAAGRGMVLEDRWRFHAEHRDMKMPGVADHVLAGTLPGTNLEGLFVMLGDAPEMRSRGEEVAFTADRPLAASALLIELDHEVPDDIAKRVGELPDEYRLEHSGRALMVWRPVAGNLVRTAEGSDRFSSKAGEVLGRAAGGSS